MKQLSYEFKEGDCVDCTNLTDEQVQRILDRMWELGAKKYEALGGRHNYYQFLEWQRSDHRTFFNNYADSYYNQITWEGIMKHEQSCDTDMENCKTPAEEAVDSPCLDDVTTWKCFKQVADVLGEEHAEYELKKVLQGYCEGTLETYNNDDLYSEALVVAFSWNSTNRGDDFWKDIAEGGLPKGYHTTPDVPSHTPKESAPDNELEELLDNVTEDNKHPTVSLELRPQSVGELVEELYSKLPLNDVTISINGNGQILLHSNTTPVVDVSKLSAEDIDKAYEAMVMLEGCFVEYNEKEGE